MTASLANIICLHRPFVDALDARCTSINSTWRKIKKHKYLLLILLPSIILPTINIIWYIPSAVTPGLMSYLYRFNQTNAGIPGVPILPSSLNK